MKKPAPGDVICAARRLAALTARNGVVGSPSLSNVLSTMTFTPLVGRLPTISFAKTMLLMPNILASNEKTHDAEKNGVKNSGARIWRPGGSRAGVPANGSVVKDIVSAATVAGRAKSAAATKT